MKRHWRKTRDGVVALELALVLPIFLLAVFGILEIGRAIMVQQVLTNGAREGARRAVVPGVTDDQVYALLDNYFANTFVAGVGRTISPSLQTAQSHDELTVSVSVPYSQVGFGIMGWISDDAILTSTVVMRKE